LPTTHPEQKNNYPLAGLAEILYVDGGWLRIAFRSHRSITRIATIAAFQ
jgi:hypothetical protein